MATVNAYVHLQDPKTGGFIVLKPDDEVPENLRDQVGDHVLNDPESDGITAADIPAADIPAAGPGQSAPGLTPEVLEQIRAAREAEAQRLADEAEQAKAEKAAAAKAKAEAAAKAKAEKEAADKAAAAKAGA